MCFHWREYLNLARCLQCKGWFTYSDEAAYRCAVSRAYYAAFCHARNYARDRQQFPPAYQSEDHWKLRNHFTEQGRPDIANKLEDLHGWRKQCDYDDTVFNICNLVAGALARADEVINELS